MSAPVVVTAFQGMIVGHDAATGRRVFAHTIGESAALGGLARIVVKAIELLVTDARIFAVAWSVVHCFEYPSGRPLGTHALAPDRPNLRPTLLLAEGRLYVGLGSRLHCLDGEGRLLWTAAAHVDDALYDSLAIAVPGAARQQDVDAT